jgi:hypothetical protein
MLPIAGYHLTHGLTEFIGIFTYEHVRAYIHRFLMLGVVVERDTGHTIERGFLGHIA